MFKTSLRYFLKGVFVFNGMSLSILSGIVFIEVVTSNIEVLLDGTENQKVDELFERESLILLVGKLDVLVKNETLALSGE